PDPGLGGACRLRLGCGGARAPAAAQAHTAGAAGRCRQVDPLGPGDTGSLAERVGRWRILSTSMEQALAPGTRLGPYEIVAPIGAGGMGVVYRARDPRLEREVAIKLLP